MCGIFGISGHEEAARLAYFGLYALQHRGQESAGIATWADGEIHSHVGMGLVPDVFTEEVLVHLPGDVSVGHVRYSTTGRPEPRNAQPLTVRMRGGMQLSLAHNGNLTNAAELRAELEDAGAIFQTTSDSEIFLHLISHCLKDMSLEEAILSACDRVEGAYCLMIQAGGKLIAVRDPHGFHPLVMGRLGDAWVFASESCAFDLLEAERLRGVRPGEMVVIEHGALEYRSFALRKSAPVRQCIFELVYFARPDSVIFGEDVYQRTLDIMVPFLAQIRDETGVTLSDLNLGGGYGVRYTQEDEAIDIPARLAELAAYLKEETERLGLPMPRFLMEPGRSIVADAGMTLYTVGSVKRIPGYKQYAAVDGGMTDNPRYALYQSRYTVYHAHKSGSMERFDVVGRCCESGDIIQPGVELPGDTCRGDLLAVCTTGAYNYSMASNYNRLPRPAVVVLTSDRIYEAVRRETFADLTALDL